MVRTVDKKYFFAIMRYGSGIYRMCVKRTLQCKAASYTNCMGMSVINV